MTVLRVGNDKQFADIISAYLYASNGDTILIDEGIYQEVLQFKNKVVNLIANTAYPEEGKVTINLVTSSKPILIVEYMVPNPEIFMYIEGIKFTTIAGVLSTSMIALNHTSGITSNLNIVFNKCTLDASTGLSTNGYIISNQYALGYAVKSILFNCCKIIWASNNLFNNTNFTAIPTRSMLRTIVSSSISETILPNNHDYKLLNDAWVYGFGPRYDEYVTSIPPTHCFSGIVNTNSSPTQNELVFLRRDNDVCVGTTVSSGINGEFYKEVFSEAQCNIICLDASPLPEYNSLILSKRVPTTLGYPMYSDICPSLGQKWNLYDIANNIFLTDSDRTISKVIQIWDSARAYNPKSTGKWYFEVKIIGSNNYAFAGVSTVNAPLNNQYCGQNSNSWGFHTFNGQRYYNGTSSLYGEVCIQNDVIGVAIDLDVHKIWWSKNGVWQGSGNPSTGLNAAYTNISSDPMFPTGSIYINSSITICSSPIECSYSPPSSFSYWPWINMRC